MVYFIYSLSDEYTHMCTWQPRNHRAPCHDKFQFKHYMCIYVHICAGVHTDESQQDTHWCTLQSSVVILNRVHKDRQIDRYFLPSDTSSQHFMSACQTCLFIEIIEHALIPCKCRAKMETREKQVWKERAWRKQQLVQIHYTDTSIMNYIRPQITPYLYRCIDR